MQMINVRLKFTKGEEVKYISHLDFMRTFQRAIRRAEIPISYSKGFNPHQEISFGAPLALGVTSSAEYLDMKITEQYDMNELIGKLNKNMPNGIKVLEAIILPEKAANAMSLVTHSRYTIKFKAKEIEEEAMRAKLENFLNQEEIIVKKEQPKKNFQLKEIDIRPMIISLNLLLKQGEDFYINCTLLAGSKANLKPELMMEAFAIFSGYELKRIKINREETYTEKAGKLISLIEA